VIIEGQLGIKGTRRRLKKMRRKREEAEKKERQMADI
jgi:hypothetical protein